MDCSVYVALRSMAWIAVPSWGLPPSQRPSTCWCWEAIRLLAFLGCRFFSPMNVIWCSDVFTNVHYNLRPHCVLRDSNRGVPYFTSIVGCNVPIWRSYVLLCHISCSCRMRYDWSIFLILILTSFLPTECRWRRYPCTWSHPDTRAQCRAPLGVKIGSSQIPLRV